MRDNRTVATSLVLLLLAAACSSTSSTGEQGLFRIEMQRVVREDQRASVRVIVTNDSTEAVELLDYVVRPAEDGASAFESLSTTGPFRLAPGQQAVSSFSLAPGGVLPPRVSVEVTFRRGEGPMERKSYWVDL